ncbi:hypothetical protein ABZX95_43725 [Streptomyces sp. NPDC004232]
MDARSTLVKVGRRGFVRGPGDLFLDVALDLSANRP